MSDTQLDPPTVQASPGIRKTELTYPVTARIPHRQVELLDLLAYRRRTKRALLIEEAIGRFLEAEAA